MLALHRDTAISPHLEVETSTWGVLPEALSLLFRRRPGDVPRAVVSLIAAVSLYDAVLIAAAGNAWLALLAVAAFAATPALQGLVSGT